MSKDNIIKLIQPGNVNDQLTEILRNGRVLCWSRRSRPRSRTFSASSGRPPAPRAPRLLPEREVMTGITA